MGFIQEDGTGDGFKQKVDKRNRALTKSITETEFTEGIEIGDGYSYSNLTYDYDAGDTILLIKNTGDADFLAVDFYLSGDTATEVAIHIITANITPAGTAVTGINLNGKSGNVAETTDIEDETDNTQGGVVWRGVIEANKTLHVPFPAIVLGKNNSIGVDYTTNGAAARVTILGFLEDE